MLTLKDFKTSINQVQDNYKHIFINQDDILGVELEKDITMTYLFVKLKGLLNYPNTCFILEGHLFNNMPIDIEKIYNVYTAEVTQMGV